MASNLFYGIPLSVSFTKKYPIQKFVKSGRFVSTDLNDCKQFVFIINEKRKKENQKSFIANSELLAIRLISDVILNILEKFDHTHPSFLDNLFYRNREFLGKEEFETLINSVKKKFKCFEDIPQDTMASGFYKNFIVLWMLNLNPALKNVRELFDWYEIYDDILEKNLSFIENYFSQHGMATEENIIEKLKLPFRKFPHSLQNQLQFILEHWGEYLEGLERLLYLSIDLHREENQFRGGGPGDYIVPSFGENEEPELFTEDKDWMPNLILLAKSTFVWLHQLSEKYGFLIDTLDKIPDEELKLIATRGFTGIWLIGIWERCNISKKIKHQLGNFDALASAYSIKKYEVNHLLGGDDAMRKLQAKAWKYHLRIGCDMVPNHMGLESDWIIEHPDWFLQTDLPPYPSYSFFGENLSEHSDVEIYLEDHYYDKTDAAVVFKFRDKRSGQVRYIYHGNDGTHTPWNDTAQLNYLKSEVRKAVMDLIVKLAHQYPIIRFDAAMTLAKKHIRRLWFPKPGTGGAIPSRAEFAMTDEQFNKLMPNEFWREVVDRVNEEAPETLLLAEAFWMMEGYFVRTLGMHRVYNSAFMNMIKNEDNEKFKNFLKEIMSFNPQILQRFVNFLSNPDEETAIAQFGMDDKYFGSCILMITMPGLPMFAHGQIEGYYEKYGMEYSHPKWNEKENSYLITRHEKEIFPIMKKRYLFSDIKHFKMYDFFTKEGVNHNVLIFSNLSNECFSLTIFNNKIDSVMGYVKQNYYTQRNDNDVFEWKKGSILTELNLHNSENHYLIGTDLITNLQYIFRSKDIYDNGFYFELKGFEYHVFTDFYEVEDCLKEHWHTLFKKYAGKGIKDIKLEIKKLYLESVLTPFKLLLSKDSLKILSKLHEINKGEICNIHKEIQFRIKFFIDAISKYLDVAYNAQNIVEKIVKDLELWLASEKYNFRKSVASELDITFICCLIVSEVGNIIDQDNKFPHSLRLFSELLLKESLIDIFNSLFDKKLSVRLVLFIELILHYLPFDSEEKIQCLFTELFSNRKYYPIINVSVYDNDFWFNKESFEDFIDFLFNILYAFESDNNLYLFLTKIKKEYVVTEYNVNEMISFLKREI